MGLVENARVAGRGATAIFFSNVLLNLISAVGAIIVIRLLSPTGYGLYTLALIPASLVMILNDWGIWSAMTKYIAQYRAEGRESDISSILAAGMLFNAGIGAALASVTFLLSDFLAGAVLLKPEAALVVKASCLLVLGTQLYNTCWYAFLGFERMRYAALTQIVFAVGKTFLAIFLVLLGFGALGATIGFGVGVIVAGVAGSLVIVFALYRSLKKGDPSALSVKGALRMMLVYGLPLLVLGVLGATGGLGAQLYNFLMARHSSITDIGNYGVASTFTVLVSFISFPISQVLFPTFSKLCGKECRKDLETTFGASVKYASFLILPAAVGVIALSGPIVDALFGDQYALAHLFLALLSVGSLFCGLGSLSMGALLQSQGRTREVLIVGLSTLAAGVPLSLVIIPAYGILGFIVNSLVVQAAGTGLYIYWVRRLFSFKAWIGRSARTYVAAFAMGGLVWATSFVLGWVGVESDGTLLVAGLIVGFTSYLLLLPLIGGIEPADLDNIGAIFGQLGLLKPVLSPLIGVMKKVVRFRERNRSLGS